MELAKSCEDARSLASREIDHELDAASVSLLEAHLASCAPCRTERASLQRIDGLFQDAFSDHPFDEKLVREIVRMAEARSVRAAPVAAPRGAIVKFRAGGLVAAAAAAVVLVAVGAGVWGGGDTKPVAPGAAHPVLARAHGTGLRVGESMNDGAEPLAVHEDEVVINQTGAGTLLLDDGTRVDLRPDTAVLLHREQDGGISVRVKASGAVFCEVAKQKHHPFRVMAGTVEAEVVGTKFLVLATGKESSVSVIEGRVRVICGTQEKLLSHDQEAIAEDARPLLIARPIADARALLAWDRRVVDALPAPAVTPRPTAPLDSSRPTIAPPVAPPTESDLDKPVVKPEQKKK